MLTLHSESCAHTECPVLQSVPHTRSFSVDFFFLNNAAALRGVPPSCTARLHSNRAPSSQLHLSSFTLSPLGHSTF